MMTAIVISTRTPLPRSHPVTSRTSLTRSANVEKIAVHGGLLLHARHDAVERIRQPADGQEHDGRDELPPVEQPGRHDVQRQSEQRHGIR